jgi:DNA-directed RNA polymerase specialized sigma24 family protein
MNSSRNSHPDFPSTIMSIIASVSEGAQEDRRTAMERMIAVYHRPMVNYLKRRTGIPLEQAEDYVQQFLLCRLIEPEPAKNLATRFTEGSRQTQRRFRDYLRTALRNFFLDEYRRDRPQKGFCSLENASQIMDEGSQPDAEYGVEVAQTLLNETIRRVKEDCLESGQQSVWDVFSFRFLMPVVTGQPAPDYAALCARGLFQSPHHARNLLQTALRKFDATLRQVVAASLPEHIGREAARVADELQDLRQLLSMGGHLEISDSLLDAGSAAPQDSAILIALMQLQDAGRADWQDQDLPGLWQELLESPVARLTSAEEVVPVRVHGLTVSSLLFSRQPDSEALQILKQLSKQIAAGSQQLPGGLPCGFFRHLYALSLAAAAVRGGQSISRGGPSELRRLADECLAVPWLDHASRKLVQDWIVSLSASR